MAGSAAGGLTVACVLHVPPDGRCDYDAGYVTKLFRMVARHLPQPHRFVCLSNVDVPVARVPLEHGWGHWWAKMELFRPDIDGRLLAIDLDTVITGDMTAIAAQQQSTMLSDFNVPAWAASGLMMLTEEDRAKVWKAWMVYPETHIKRQGGHGDGGFIRAVLDPVARWQDLLPGQVVSYKNHVRPAGKVPPGARVVCFHGRPRPAELGEENFMKVIWNG